MSADHEREVVTALVTRTMTVENGTDPFDGYIRIRGGSNMSRARAVAAPLQLRGMTTPQAIEAVLKRLRVAKAAAGGKNVHLEIVPRGETHAADWETLDGEGVDVRDVDDEDEGDGSVGKHAPATALAVVARQAMAETRWMTSRLMEHLDHSEHVKVTAAAALARIAEIEKNAGNMEFAQALKDYAPVAQAAIPEAMRTYVAYLEKETARLYHESRQGKPGPNGEDLPPEPEAPKSAADKVRGTIKRIEDDASSLQLQVAAMMASGEMTPDLQGELIERFTKIAASYGFKRG